MKKEKELKDIKKYKALLRKYHTQVKVAQVLGVSREAVCQRIKHLGISYDKDKARKYYKSTKNKDHKLYYKIYEQFSDTKDPCRKIADQFNVSVNTVYNIVKYMSNNKNVVRERLDRIRSGKT